MSYEDFTKKWPTSKVKKISQRISVDGQKTEAIIFDFETHGRESPRKLCSGDILVEDEESEFYSTAQNLWLTASDLGDSLATLQLMTRAHKSNTLMIPSLANAREHIKDLARRGNPAALFYHGVFLEDQNRVHDALNLYTQSIEARWEHWREIHSLDLYGGDIWIRISAAKNKLKNRAGAHEALRVAAVEYDDPKAYYHLARSFVQSYEMMYEEYMLKAAASGNINAAHELGLYYFRQSKGSIMTGLNKGGTRKPHASFKPLPAVVDKTRELAQQWFAVAADAGVVSSMVHIAVLVRGPDFAVYGQDWLDKAQAADVQREWSNTIKMLGRQKYDPSLEFRGEDIEAMQAKLDGSRMIGRRKR
ncbi:MAG: hypothetical protein Q9164_005712 [Protoblastenia rupestris]